MVLHWKQKQAEFYSAWNSWVESNGWKWQTDYSRNGKMPVTSREVWLDHFCFLLRKLVLIVYMVSIILSRFMDKPTKTHMQGSKRISLHLHGTSKLKFVHGKKSSSVGRKWCRLDWRSKWSKLNYWIYFKLGSLKQWCHIVSNGKATNSRAFKLCSRVSRSSSCSARSIIPSTTDMWLAAFRKSRQHLLVNIIKVLLSCQLTLYFTRDQNT